MQTKSYLLWADITRILAIYLVVVVHTTVFSTSNNLFHFFSFAFSKTSIPLFLMLSGALLLPKIESYATFFQKRVSRVILPWIVWSIIYFLFLTFSSGQSISSMKELIKGVQRTMMGYWYMPMILGIYMITPLLRTFVHAAKRYEILFLLSIWFITISFLPFFHDTLAFPFHSENSLVKQVLFYVGYFLFGYLVTLYSFPKKTPIYAGLLFILGVLLTIFLTIPLSIQTHNLTFFEYISPTIVLSSTALFVFLYSYFQKRTISKNLKALIRSVSDTTYGIFFLHILVIGVIALPQIKHIVPLLQKHSEANELLLGFIYFTISFCIIWIMRRIPKMHRLIS